MFGLYSDMTDSLPIFPAELGASDQYIGDVPDGRGPAELDARPPGEEDDRGAT